MLDQAPDGEGTQPEPICTEHDAASHDDKDDQQDDPAAAATTGGPSAKTKVVLQPIKDRVEHEQLEQSLQTTLTSFHDSRLPFCSAMCGGQQLVRLSCPDKSIGDGSRWGKRVERQEARR